MDSREARIVFPALTSAVKGVVKAVRDGLGSEPLELGLKSMDVPFDTVNVGWYARNGYPQLFSILSGGLPAWSGETVSLATALNHSVVWACTDLISSTLGSLPLIMMRDTNNGKVLATDHPMFNAMKNAPNDEMTAMSFRESRTAQTLLHGNGYAQITRRSGTGVAFQLHPLDASQVRVDRERTGQKRLVYVVKEGMAPEQTFTIVPGQPQDILHIRGFGFNGIQGFSVIQLARQSIGTALSAERHVARFYAGGGRVPYVLTSERKFKDEEDFQKFRKDWEQAYSEPHRVPILENNIKYQQIGLNAVDSQMLEMRLFDIHEICRWFLVSPHLVGDLSRATFSNIEQLALEFVKITLSHWLTRWEQELWRCVLTDEEKRQGFFFRHNLDALLRGDFQSRMAGYATLLQNGVNAINEIRDLEGWNPVKGGDVHHIQLNMQSVPQSSVTLGDESPALVRLAD